MSRRVPKICDTSRVAFAVDTERTIQRMRVLWPIVIVLTTSGCGVAVAGGMDVPRPDLPGCDQAQEFAFVGETTLGALGLPDAGGPDASRVGMIWVTADRVLVDMGRPAPIGGDGPIPVEAPSRMVCVLWPDGSGMTMPIDDRWQPPAAAQAVTTDAPLPTGPLVIGIMLVVFIGVSVLAFRHDRPADG